MPANLPFKRILRPYRLRTAPREIIGLAVFLVSVLFFASAAQLVGHTDRPRAIDAPATQTKASVNLDAADRILQEMSRITGLPVRAPLRKQVASRKEVQQFLSDSLRSEYTPAEIHVQEAEIKAFGLAPPDFDLAKFLVDFYTEQAAGYYDPKRKTMFIADWIGSDTQEMVLSHELTHALQDQNFDLDKFLRAARDNDDATAARQAVAEGYATAAMTQRALGSVPLEKVPSLRDMMELNINQEMKEFPTFSKAPFFFRYQALFPYSEGVRFMQRGLEKGGWPALSLAFTEPPGTTKAIFQPEFYYGHRATPELQMPRPPALTADSRLHFVSVNVLGQLGYYVLLGQLVNEDEAKKVSAGWQGDRFVLYEDPTTQRYTLLARVLWDNGEYAADFFKDYQTILRHKYMTLHATEGAANMWRAASESGDILLLARGNECRWAEGVPAGQAEAVMQWLQHL